MSADTMSISTAPEPAPVAAAEPMVVASLDPADAPEAAAPPMPSEAAVGTAEPKKSSGPRKAPQSRSSRAGLLFPVGRVHRKLKENQEAPRVSALASVYMAGVLEYMAAEVLELAGKEAHKRKRKTIDPCAINMAIKSDEELLELSNRMGIIVAGGGVTGFRSGVHLFPKKQKNKRPSSSSSAVPFGKVASERGKKKAKVGKTKTKATKPKKGSRKAKRRRV